ncbi:MAG TPA: MBL fold metallo-hydrolase [Clostridiaceae bacterium]|nr:MBL fold metallo-hydrolase [Clostridiaceae bacterium]
MKITFLGAARTVTGSCFYIETKDNKFLVDCGFFQGYKDGNLNEDPFPFDPSKLDFILLTHAHIDHSGRIPKIFLEGFKGEVIATKATCELCRIMLPDSGYIQEFENEWLNRKRLRAGKPPVKPLYTHQDAINCMELFRSVSYGELVQINKNIKVRFNDAGHMLGSAIIELWAEENDRITKLVFSGDLGNKGMPILRDPEIIEDADYLIIESTYGNRLHMGKSEKADKFAEIILNTVKRGGNIVIPSFAVGRTQEIIYELNKQLGKNDPKYQKIMNLPVFVDSPLAISATEVFRNNLDCYDEEARSYIESGDNPLDFPTLRFTRTAEESKKLNNNTESKIIISASGMCEAGRIKHHLKHNLWRQESSIIFVGYQAEGTLGRKLLDGAKKVKIFGEEISVNAHIEMLEGFSGHADKEGLLSWIKAFSKKPRKIFIVHGENQQIEEFAEIIKNELKIDTVIPSLGETYKITPEKTPISSIVTSENSRVVYSFKRLEVLTMLDKLKDEFDEVASILTEDLKKETDDQEVQQLIEKLNKLEKELVNVLR